MSDNLIEIKNLDVEYKSDKGVFHGVEIVHAVNDLSVDIKKGEILAVAGESGCGKSTLARAIVGLTPVKSGVILYENEDVLAMDKKTIKKFRQKAQMIFQNPYSSLNPKMTIYEILKEPLIINTKYNKEKMHNIIVDVACQVGIDEGCLKLYPHEFSGGQRQRIAIARALILQPDFILADEPVSALDVSIQAQIINLLKSLKDKFNLTFMLISHDMSIIKYLADRVAIMYLGEIVEIGTNDEIFKTPKHPYTQALLSAVPSLDEQTEQILLTGDLPSPSNMPRGCKFHTRCPHCMPICKDRSPLNISISDTHAVACFLH